MSTSRSSEKSTPHQKLTQSQRSEITKGKLVAATMQSLVQRGYAQTSTQVICDLAGLSKGGLFRQYPSSADLMIDTAKRTYDSLISQFDDEFIKQAEANSKARRVVSAVQNIIQSDGFQAILELTIASRTDEKLKNGLVPILQNNIKTVLKKANQVFPDAALSNPKFEAVIHLLVLAFQGEVIDDLVYQTKPLAQARFDLLVEIVEKELETGHQTHP